MLPVIGQRFVPHSEYRQRQAKLFSYNKTPSKKRERLQIIIVRSNILLIMIYGIIILQNREIFQIIYVSS